MSMLEHSLEMKTVGDALIAVADPEYEANTGMFGGWTAALLLKAVLEHPDCHGSASALTVNFVGRVVPGETLLITRTELGKSKSLSHWRADLHRGGTKQILATALAVLALRRTSESAIDFSCPATPLPEQLPASNPPGAFGRRTDMRASYGLPPLNRADMRSLSWVRENSERHVDAIQLAYLSDVYAPRVFHISKELRPSSTLTMSTYFLAAPAELAAIGDDYVLSEVEGTRIEQSLVGSRSRLWSRQGTLLATAEQLCWFK
ncbi:MAG: thioesterase family protein [Sphingomicrobium sp.]